MGGTFDNFHLGHRLLLTFSSWFVNNKGTLCIGITDDKLLSKKILKHMIQDLETRKSKVNDFILSIRSDIKCELQTINDPIGPAGNKFDCKGLLIVTSETRSGIDFINNKRKELGFELLDYYVIENLITYSSAFDDNKKISSTDVRYWLAKRSNIDSIDINDAHDKTELL